MRYGHEAGGLIGITLQPSAVARWALSLHICSQLRGELAAMKEGRQEKIVTHHKEEYNARKQTDAVDRAKIRDTLTAFISPLDTSSHPSCLVNIATRLLAPSNVNMDSSMTIGTQQMEEYELGWPQSFHRVLNKRIITMAVTKKSIKINDTPIYATDLTHTRVIGLQQSRDIDIKKVLTYVLSPVSPALF